MIALLGVACSSSSSKKPPRDDRPCKQACTRTSEAAMPTCGVRPNVQALTRSERATADEQKRELEALLAYHECQQRVLLANIACLKACAAD